MQTAMFGMLAVAFNSPVYASIQVQDPAVVDRTLEKLDLFLARVAGTPSDQLGGFISIEQDFYLQNGNSDPSVRAYAFRFGPITWRFYWTRIGNGLYIASKPYLIDELKAAAAQPSTVADDSEVGHGMVRVRPLHWNEIKSHFRIGWAEAERQTCLDQVGTLSHATRAVRSEDGDEVQRTLVSSGTRLAEQVFQRGFNCPCHGKYSAAEDGKTIQCSVHGTLQQPRQSSHGKLGRIAEFAESLKDVRMDLTFLEDGLHAVVTLETNGR